MSETVMEAIRELRILTTCSCDDVRREIGQHRTDCLAEYRSDVEILANALDGYDSEDSDPEQFCPLCFAGMESSEHHEKCVTWRDEWQDQGFPWCDTCGAAAVFSESFGNLHTSRQYPHGVPKGADQSGHAVTMRQWSEAGIAWRGAR